jgi:hypothetical protein
LWKVLDEQLRGYNEAVNEGRPNPTIAAVRASIRLVEAQLRKEQPPLSNQKEVSEYVRRKYLSKFKGLNYITNSEGVAVWAAPYFYYLIGMWPNFAVSLSERGRPGIQLT